MKKIAFCYKGVFGLKKIVHSGIDEETISLLNQNIENHLNIFHDGFNRLGYELDYHISTYDINDEINEIVRNALNPNTYSFIPNEYLHGSTWISQLTHFRNLVNSIKNTGIEYDLIVMTRQDLKVKMDFEEIYRRLNLEEFNITIGGNGYPSGNCDDNFFVFPSYFLETFGIIIEEMINSGAITHEINHYIARKNIPINYISEFMPEIKIWAHEVFEMYRPGQIGVNK